MKRFLRMCGVIFCLIQTNYLVANNFEPSKKNFYVGGNVGFANLQSFLNFPNPVLGSPEGSAIAENADWTAGCQLGYNWTCRHRLIGITADWNWSNAEGKRNFFENNPQTDHEHKTRLKWFTTVRARFGLSLCNTLFYLTGGGIVGNLRLQTQNIASNAVGKRTIDKERLGWVLGTGAEYRICAHWGINAEILYLKFKRFTYNLDILNPGTGAVTTRYFINFNHAWVGRIGLNYHFNLCNLCSRW